MANPKTDKIETVLHDLLISGQYSDFTITCRGNTFPVHRNIICQQTRFFHVAANEPFVEAISKTLDLPADDPRTILRVLCYLYTRQYDALNDVVSLVGVSEADDGDQAPAEGDDSDRRKNEQMAYNHLRVYVAADKYGIPTLKSLAMKQFHDCLAQVDHDLLPEILREIKTTVPRHDDSELGNFLRPAVELLASNIPKITEVEGIRDILWEFHALTVGIVYDQAIQIATLNDRIKVLEANKRVLKQRIGDEKKQQNVLTDRHETDLRIIAARLKQLPKCKGCNAPFNAKIQREHHDMISHVRCKLCNMCH